ncbi:zinc-binding alcohol dehydrogenase family protein [Acinetobacter sp. ANC 3832]|uniref:zinc-binding alcohol dehydrogenase family protein n=1 Tax=Acinetobacter sp. ANC 3832 TaxID=1977874 RepID=UPI000A33BB02|nr:zinc-binding alcohol dehydrogenase family protein [Acinetobacter sp. ANC 3832]OTG92566.1 Zn-dependent oxidoreductase [Acinetobacter sp. ANC 3832]
MKVVAYKKPCPITHPNVFTDVELAQPIAKDRDLLIAVHAISINPVDIKVRLRTPESNNDWKILGRDAVGTVQAVGENVQNFKVGDQVFYAGTINRDGSYAEYQLVDERIVGHKPTTLNHAEAAAMPLTSITAWEMLFDRLKVQDASNQNATILVIGAAGGVGSITVQLLKALTDFKVIATASRPESKAWLEQIGADYIVDHRQPLEQQVLDLKIGLPSYIFAVTGTENYTKNIENLIAPQGHFGLIDDPENFVINGFKAKSVSIHWESMFTRSVYQTTDMSRQGEILDKIAELVDEGKIKTTLSKTFGVINAENITKAHAFIESGKSIGKIVLEGF